MRLWPLQNGQHLTKQHCSRCLMIIIYIWSLTLPFNMLLLLTQNFLMRNYVCIKLSPKLHFIGIVCCIFKAHNWTGRKNELTLRNCLKTMHYSWNYLPQMTVITERIYYYCIIYFQAMISIIKLNPFVTPQNNGSKTVLLSWIPISPHTNPITSEAKRKKGLTNKRKTVVVSL